MRSGLGVFLVLLLLTPQCFSSYCRTCKNEECSSANIPLIKCNKHVPKLPFQKLTQTHKEDLYYGCLQLEYLNGNFPTALQQCIITEDIHYFCISIAKTAHVVQCTVNLPTNNNLEKKTFHRDTRTIDEDTTVDVNYSLGSPTQSNELPTTWPPSTPYDVKMIPEHEKPDAADNRNALTTLTNFEEDITDKNSSDDAEELVTTTIWPSSNVNGDVDEVLSTVTLLSETGMSEEIQDKNELRTTSLYDDSTTSYELIDSSIHYSDFTTTEKTDYFNNYQESIAGLSTSVPGISDGDDLKWTETLDTTTINALDGSSSQGTVPDISNNLLIPESEVDSAVVSSSTTPQSETASFEEAGDLEYHDDLTHSPIIPPEPERTPNSISGHRSSFYILIMLASISLLNLQCQ